ncbi:MAG: OsmC family protein [Chloroflexota bacterium]
MEKLNNVDLVSLEKMLKAAQEDPSKLRRTQVLEGEWLLDAAAGAQFRGEVAFEKGKAVMEADQPSMLGGGGRTPGPMHYCFYGVAACYAGTYANLAAMMGIKLRKLAVKVEAKQDFSRVFGLSDAPFIEELKVTLAVRGDAPREKLEEVENLAYQRCPAVYNFTHVVPLKTRLVVEQRVSKAEVMDVLEHVYDPDYFDRSIVDMGLVTEDDVETDADKVKVSYRLSAPICPFSAAIGLMMKHALEAKLGVVAEVRLKAGHYQYDVVNEVLSSEEKSRDLLQKMESYGVLQKCIRW